MFVTPSAWEASAASRDGFGEGQLWNERIPDCPYAFAHATGRKAGEPLQDVKKAFQTALETAEIKDFTWHDLRQHAGSRIMPGPAWEGAFRACNGQFSACQVGIIRLSSHFAALEPGMEETCSISLSKVATRFGAYDREFLARILTRSRSISPDAGTRQQRLARS